MKNDFQIRMDIDGLKDFLKRCVDKYFQPQEIKKKNYQKVKIRTCDDGPVFAKLYIGDEEIHGIRRWSITHEAGNIPVLHIDISACNMDIDQRCICIADGWGDFALRMINPCSNEMDGEKEGE